jgi:hypothetical protein
MSANCKGIRGAEEFLRIELARYFLTSEQIDTVIGWMKQNDQQQMVRFGKSFGYIEDQS